jgi:hypothetical protein
VTHLDRYAYYQLDSPAVYGNVGWWGVPADIAKNTQTSSLPFYSDKIFELNPSGLYAAFREFAAFNA